MSNLIAYHDVDTARAVAAELDALTKEKSIELDDREAEDQLDTALAG